MNAPTQLEALSSAECIAKLSARCVGRVGLIAEGCPHVLPVNYAADATGEILYRTAAESLLATVGGKSVVFEVDGFDETAKSGWSVCVHGEAHERALPRLRPALGSDRGDDPDIRLRGLALLRVQAQRLALTVWLCALATIDDIRPLALSLPRAYEALVRDRVKFRVGQYVWLAFSRDETMMGFAFPKEEREALVASEPHKFLMPKQSDMRYNWVVVRLDQIDEDEAREIVLDAWRMVVPKKVARELLGD